MSETGAIDLLPASELADFRAGTHPRPWLLLGAHPQRVQGLEACASRSGRRAPPAPASSAISTTGTVAAIHAQARGSGVWEAFVPASARRAVSTNSGTRTARCCRSSRSLRLPSEFGRPAPASSRRCRRARPPAARAPANRRDGRFPSTKCTRLRLATANASRLGFAGSDAAGLRASLGSPTSNCCGSEHPSTAPGVPGVGCMRPVRASAIRPASRVSRRPATRRLVLGSTGCRRISRLTRTALPASTGPLYEYPTRAKLPRDCNP